MAPATKRPVPPLRSALKATGLLWALVTLVMLVLTLWSGQTATAGDILTTPLTWATAAGLAMGLYLVFRLTAAWPGWLSAGALAGAIVGLGLLQTLVDRATQIGLRGSLMPDISPLSDDPAVIARVVLIYVAVNACNAAILWLMAALEQAREQGRLAAQAQLDSAQAKAAALESELRALRLQLDPHFMFNALNSVAGLIATGRAEQAEAMVVKLSQFLRAALGGGAAKVSLADELGGVSAYLEVEHVRFPDRILLDVDCPAELHAALVPDFALQPFVENSVKYGLASGGVIRIRIAAQADGPDLRLVIEDDGAGVSDQAAGFGLGQSTTEQRLASLYGPAASLSAARTPQGYRVDLRLPLEFAA